ncbi:MAG: hypothetical protein GY821_01280 [Gammaproteobacteria bacterium]|nr:hypothetical protein [Gammaproteobacteria bacterium]
MKANESKCKQMQAMQANESKCKQKQANASESKQMQSMQAIQAMQTMQSMQANKQSNNFYSVGWGRRKNNARFCANRAIFNLPF